MLQIETEGSKIDKTRTAPVRGGNVFHAAEKSAEFYDHLRAHYRETRRSDVEIESDVEVVLSGGEIFDRGQACIRNVSPSGALLTQLKLNKGTLPLQNFRLVLTLKSDNYKGISIEATPVRMTPAISGLGVKFDEIFVSV